MEKYFGLQDFKFPAPREVDRYLYVWESDKGIDLYVFPSPPEVDRELYRLETNRTIEKCSN